MEITRNEWNSLLSTVMDNNAMLKRMVDEAEKKMLTPKEVQEFLKIGKTTYQRYLENKILKQIKIGGKAYVQRSEIERLIEEGKI